MRLSRTVFEILSLIFQKIKRSRDSNHAFLRDNLSPVGWDLIMFNPHVKFEMSTITCNEEMKGNAKCKPFGGLSGNVHGYLWLAGKRVVDFLLPQTTPRDSSGAIVF